MKVFCFFFIYINVNLQAQVLKYTVEFDRILCMTQCNLIDDCATSIYNSLKPKTVNCYLYRKYFSSSELTVSNGSNLYNKECEYTVKF